MEVIEYSWPDSSESLMRHGGKDEVIAHQRKTLLDWESLVSEYDSMFMGHGQIYYRVIEE